MAEVAIEVTSLGGELLLSTVAAASSSVDDIHGKLEQDEGRRARQTLLCQDKKLSGTEALQSLASVSEFGARLVLTLNVVEQEALNLHFVACSDDIDCPTKWTVNLVPATTDSLRALDLPGVEEASVEWLEELLGAVRMDARGVHAVHIDRLVAMARSASTPRILERSEDPAQTVVLVAGHRLTLTFSFPG
eukprot:TRINITY_DN69129_c0_g1_i1.p1 TRINITY_DN69129_c0_g1~~TRINITY_DN69129_c0_g1_i1.p1  ORF type:complete len:191 (-),score=32.77 TRINITY_DN69129_c0_g1_i1:158-730(-)